MHDAVPDKDLLAEIKSIFKFLGMDPNRSDHLSRPPLRPTGMVEAYQHHALLCNGLFPKVCQDFRNIHRNFEEWFKTQSRVRHPRSPILTNLAVKPVSTKAGDLVL